MKFKKEVLQLLADGEKVEGFEVVRDKIKDTSQWLIFYDLVFTHDGKFYEKMYSVGATEYQDERPFEYESDEVECTEVKPVGRTVIDYVPV